MPSTSIQMRNIVGTEAAMGWAGSHTIVADRPEGKAGGRGLGFNRAELLGLTIGGCFCNDLRYVAHRRGVEIETIAVDVTVELEGGQEIVSVITLTSVENLGIEVGSSVYAVIKATEVMLGIDE